MTKKYNILFRTSGGSAENHELGTGHIFRCINLAKKLTKSKILFVVEDYGGIKEILSDNNFHNVYYLKPNINKKEDIKKTKNIIKKEKIDIIIIDKFRISKSYINHLKKDVTTVYISDLFNYDFPADLVVNGFIGLKNSKKMNSYGAVCLLGPKYQILSNVSIKKKPKTPKYDLLITLGGYDKNNNLDRLTEIIPDYLSKLKIKIILGPSSPKSKKLVDLEKKFKQNLEVIRYSKKLRKDIINSKYGLSGGGITTYEFALLQVPFFIICQYYHQIITARYWKKFGYSFGYVRPNDKTMKKIEQYLQKLDKHKISLNKKKLRIDNLGVSRVTKEIQKLKIKSKV